MRENNLKILILFLTLITLSFIPIKNCFCTEIDLYESREIQYKSIKFEDYYSNLSPIDAIKLIIQQENDLKQYLSGRHSIEENTGLFRLYYKNLQALVKSINNMNLVLESWGYQSDNTVHKLLETLKYNGIYCQTFQWEDSENYCYPKYLTIINPKTNTIEIIYEGEGYYSFHINDSYIANSYAMYLNNSWRDYMNIKKCIYDDLNHLNFFNDGCINPDGLTVAKWTVKLEQFIKKYPNFELIDEINNYRCYYGTTIMYRKYFLEYNNNKSYLSKDLRLGSKYYIEHGDKNTKLYRKIKKDYELWLKNNFEYDKIENNYVNSSPDDFCE